MRPIYLNHAATSFPKPDEVVEAVTQSLRECPSDAGREGGAAVDPRGECRASLARLLSVADPSHVILTFSATYAINLVVRGFQSSLKHVVTTSLEHNGLLRPLTHLAQEHGLQVSVLEPDASGWVSPTALRKAFTRDTGLVAVNHASNVTGAVQPIQEIAEEAARAGIPLLVDASQTAGCVPVDHQSLPGRVFMAFAGHKGLLGPSGTGGLVVPDADLPSWVVGGTGSDSARPTQPQTLPVKYEAGTPNWSGIAGLNAGIRHILSKGVLHYGAHRAALVNALRQDMASIPGVRLMPTAGDDFRAGIVSFTFSGMGPEETGHMLKHAFGITVRTGLHCAPLAHRHLGTEPHGTVRASFGWSSVLDDARALTTALRLIARAV